MFLNNLFEELSLLAEKHYGNFEKSIPENVSDGKRRYTYDAFKHVFGSAYMTLKYGSGGASSFRWFDESRTAVLSNAQHKMEIWNRAVGRRVGEYYSMLWWERESSEVTDDTDELVLEMARQIFNKIWEVPVEGSTEEPEYRIPDDIHIIINPDDDVLAEGAQKIVLCVPECVFSSGTKGWDYLLRAVAI